MNDAQPVLTCRGLKKNYHDGKNLYVEVLKDLDLQVGAGEMVAIVGASGSGKSTLMHILGGLDHADDGEVRVLNQDILAMNEVDKAKLRNRSMGFVYQFHHLLPEFDALENVCMPLLIGGMARAQAIKRASSMIEEVGLRDRMHHRIAELSGGERQRIAIARALVSEPACVLADEPTGNLDEDCAVQVFNLMLNLNQRLGTSFVVVTHNMVIARRMQRILVLKNGCLQDMRGIE